MIFNNIQEKAYNYLNRTYVRAINPSTGMDQVVYCRSGDNRITLINEFGDPFDVTNKNIKQFKFCTPKLGYLLLDKKLVFAWRKATRQSKTGLTEANTVPVAFTTRDCDFVFLRALNKVHREEYDNYFVSPSNTSRPLILSKNYAISQKTNTVFYGGHTLGVIKDKVLYLDNPLKAKYHNKYLPSLAGILCQYAPKAPEPVYQRDDI